MCETVKWKHFCLTLSLNSEQFYGDITLTQISVGVKGMRETNKNYGIL